MQRLVFTGKGVRKTQSIGQGRLVSGKENTECYVCLYLAMIALCLADKCLVCKNNNFFLRNENGGFCEKRGGQACFHDRPPKETPPLQKRNGGEYLFDDLIVDKTFQTEQGKGSHQIQDHSNLAPKASYGQG